MIAAAKKKPGASRAFMQIGHAGSARPQAVDPL